MLAGQKTLNHLLGDEFEIADTGETFGIKVGHQRTSTSSVTKLEW